MSEPQPNFTVRVDWLQASLPIERMDALQDLLTEACELRTDNWKASPHGALGYTHRKTAELPNGAVLGIHWTPSKDGQPARPETHAQVPGKACALIGQLERWPWLMKQLDAMDAKPSRLDFTGDDFTKCIYPREVYAEYHRGAAVTRSRKWDWHESGDREHPERGESFYIGSENSPRRLTVYDKNVESGGLSNCIRWEMRCRNEAALAVWLRLTRENTNGWGAVFAPILVGFVDFREPNSARDKKAWKRCTWFESLVGSLAGAPLGSEQDITEDAVRRFVLHVEQTLPSTLATFAKLMGSNSLRALVERGKGRLSRRHKALLDAARELRASRRVSS